MFIVKLVITTIIRHTQTPHVVTPEDYAELDLCFTVF